ncbi:hypothetical protein OIU76_029982 [Salix suchowensis]|nr:hypothetical protein OIU76_029982 [Salix suchowensis]
MYRKFGYKSEDLGFWRAQEDALLGCW